MKGPSGQSWRAVRIAIQIQGPGLRRSPPSDKLHNCDVMIREDVSNPQVLCVAVNVMTSLR